MWLSGEEARKVNHHSSRLTVVMSVCLSAGCLTLCLRGWSHYRTQCSPVIHHTSPPTHPVQLRDYLGKNGLGKVPNYNLKVGPNSWTRTRWLRSNVQREDTERTCVSVTAIADGIMIHKPSRHPRGRQVRQERLEARGHGTDVRQHDSDSRCQSGKAPLANCRQDLELHTSSCRSLINLPLNNKHGYQAKPKLENIAPSPQACRGRVWCGVVVANSM
ncbi:hypothetical protein J6590_038679 [Homalodisca vitripennis]|nr:hypothetical protein J6590_038679 [Homalodisca vitripennis]